MIYFLGILSLFNILGCKEVSHIASRHFHGFKDNSMSYESINNVMKIPKLEMSCGEISNFTVKYLQQKGIEARFIMTLTLDEWNSYNNGHSMVEVWDGNQWVLWDIDLKNVFMKGGRLLNAKQLTEFNDYEIVSFSPADKFSPQSIVIMKQYGLDLLSEKGLREFYRRCAQVVMIRKDNQFYFTCDPENVKRVKSYPTSTPFHYLPEKDFTEIFYPK